MGTYPVSKPRPGSRLSDVCPELTAAPAPGFIHAWTRFWFAPTDPAGLHVVRIATGLVCLSWLLPLAGQVEALFGLGGYFDLKALQEAAKLPGGLPPQSTWSLLFLCDSTVKLLTVYWLSVAVLVLFTIGVG